MILAVALQACVEARGLIACATLPFMSRRFNKYAIFTGPVCSLLE
jgi:hypothetical protein